MDTTYYPKVDDLDELFGFSAAKKRAEEPPASAPIDDDARFVPHRIFLNHVDSFNGKHISSYLADQIYGSVKQTVAFGGEEGEEQVAGEEEVVAGEPKRNYEVIGTLKSELHKKSEDVRFVVDEDDVDEIIKCGFVIYDITQDKDEIPKALKTLTAIENDIEKLKELGPKTFAAITEVRTFVLISTVATWGLTKPIDPDEPELPFAESDYRKRRAHPNFKEHLDCEKEVVQKGQKFKDKLKTYVIGAGLVYGMEEEDLFALFKMAWRNEEYLPIFGGGRNNLPLIHIDDLARILHLIMENSPKVRYHLAVEPNPSSLKQIVKALANKMGTGKTVETSKEEAFLYNEISQPVFDKMALNLNMEPGVVVEELGFEFRSEEGLAGNMEMIVSEFRKSRGLTPIRIVLHGPPAIGKTQLAKQLCDHYGLHYLDLKSAIEETVNDLRRKIESEKVRINKEIEEQEEEQEVEEEAEEIDVEELEERLREIEAGNLAEEQFVAIVKAIMTKNRCFNQGYVLDGFPETQTQARALFEVESLEPGEEEEEAGEGMRNPLPEFVISLEATDDFICERVMDLPEKLIQGTDYEEQAMLRRLAEFRERNTEDTTVLNFFDELEIHPIVIDATTHDAETATEKVAAKVGKPIAFAATLEEEQEKAKVDAEKAELQKQQDKMEREAREKDIEKEYDKKMEDWLSLLEQLQLEEEKILFAQSEPLRDYLVKFVFPTLTRGLLEVARLKPGDPVDFLAEFLFKENPEGRMFDPAYTRRGQDITAKFQQL